MKPTHGTVVTVPYRGNHLTMTLEEAQTLHKYLGHAIERAIQRKGELLDAELTPEGHLTRDAVYEFFVQLYPNRHVLRNHAGKLFSRICELARYGEVPVAVLCPDCGKLIGPKVECTNRSNRVHWDVTRLLINASSLTQHRHVIAEGTFRQVGPAFVEDLDTLITHL